MPTYPGHVVQAQGELEHRMGEPLFVCGYTLTESYKSITEQVGVCNEKGEMVAVCGPSGDQQSLQDAQVFAVAGPLAKCAMEIMEGVNTGAILGVPPALQVRLIELVAKAGGAVDNRFNW